VFSSCPNKGCFSQLKGALEGRIITELACNPKGIYFADSENAILYWPLLEENGILPYLEQIPSTTKRIFHRIRGSWRRSSCSLGWRNDHWANHSTHPTRGLPSHFNRCENHPNPNLENIDCSPTPKIKAQFWPMMRCNDQFFPHRKRKKLQLYLSRIWMARKTSGSNLRNFLLINF